MTSFSIRRQWHLHICSAIFHRSVTLRGTGELITASQFRGRIPLMTSSRRKLKSRAGPAQQPHAEMLLQQLLLRARSRTSAYSFGSRRSNKRAAAPTLLTVQQAPHVAETLIGDVFMVDVCALPLARQEVGQIHGTSTAAVHCIKGVPAIGRHRAFSRGVCCLHSQLYSGTCTFT